MKNIFLCVALIFGSERSINKELESNTKPILKDQSENMDMSSSSSFESENREMKSSDVSTSYADNNSNNSDDSLLSSVICSDELEEEFEKLKTSDEKYGDYKQRCSLDSKKDRLETDLYKSSLLSTTVETFSKDFGYDTDLNHLKDSSVCEYFRKRDSSKSGRPSSRSLFQKKQEKSSLNKVISGQAKKSHFLTAKKSIRDFLKKELERPEIVPEMKQDTVKTFIPSDSHDNLAENKFTAQLMFPVDIHRRKNLMSSSKPSKKDVIARNPHLYDLLFGQISSIEPKSSEDSNPNTTPKK